MNREDLEKLPTETLVAITLADMKMRLMGHRNFLEMIVVLRETGKVAIARDVPARTPQEAVTKMITSEPGRLDDPRINDLVLPLAQRLTALAERLVGKVEIDDVTGAEMSELIKDIKQFGADIKPVYDWHAEMRRDFEREEVALN